MERTITLADGEHTLTTPPMYAAELMRTWADDPAGPLCIGIAAVMTTAGGFDSRYRPNRVWYPGEVATLMPLSADEREAVAAVVWELLADADIVAGGEEQSSGRDADPTPGGDTPSKQP